MNKQMIIVGGIIFILALTFFYPQNSNGSNNETNIDEPISQANDFTFQNSGNGRKTFSN